MIADNSKVRIGFIGAGYHASWTLYPSLQYFENDVELVGVCDLDEAKAESARCRFGAKRCYTDYIRMLDAEELDAVFCCGGPRLHADVIAECVRRKMPLFVEKPPAPTSTELRELAQQANAAGSAVMIAFMHRFAPVTMWAKKAIANEGFGKTMMIYAREGLWGMDKEHLVMDSGIHHIDLMRALCGEVEWVQAVSCTDGAKRHAIAVTMMFRNAVMGQLNLNSLESLTTPSDVVEIHGDNGQWIRLDNWSRATWTRDPGVYFSPPNDPLDSSLYYEHGWTAAADNRSTVLQGYIGEIRHFLECIKSGLAPKPDLWDGYRDIQLVEAINLSVKTDERINITSDKDITLCPAAK